MGSRGRSGTTEYEREGGEAFSARGGVWGCTLGAELGLMLRLEGGLGRRPEEVMSWAAMFDPPGQPNRG